MIYFFGVFLFCRFSCCVSDRGQPQIDVCFDIDANCILNVHAVEKSTGKANKITIVNEKGRLSQDEIEHMVGEAERYKAEDDANRNRVEAKNRLENYCISIQNSVLKGIENNSKLSQEDRKVLENKVNETLKWIECHHMGSKEEYEIKQKALEDAELPILQKMGTTGMD